MAVTGIILLGFVLAHMIGNLKMLPRPGGDQPLRRVAARRSASPPCPARSCCGCMRIGSSPRSSCHIHAAYQLTRMNQKARPTQLPVASATTSPPTSPSARCAGPASSSLLFLVFHLLDLTWGTANPHFVRGDPYNNLVVQLPAACRSRSSTSSPTSRSASTSSTARGRMFQSLGLNNPRCNTLAPLLRRSASRSSSSSATSASRSLMQAGVGRA